MQTNNANDLEDIGFDLTITKVTRQAAGTGTWIRGSVLGHRFEALVYAGHADDSAWEMDNSRISKLWLQRTEDKETVFNWDRGADIAPKTDVAAQIVDFLKTGIADFAA